MHDIFISYAKVDHEIARTIAEALNQEGFKVWWDVDIPTGSTFDAAIEQAVADAKCVIVLWSENSTKSEWVHVEAAEGKARNILVPILVSDANIPFAFRRRQTADLRPWLKDRSHPAFERVLVDIRKLCDPSGSQSKNTDQVTAKRRIDPIPAGPSIQEQLPETKIQGKSNTIKKIVGIAAIIALMAMAAFYFMSGQTLEVGDSYEGGIIFQISTDGSSMKICAEEDMGMYTWYDAKDIAKTYDGGGHADWRLPTKEELNTMYNRLSKEGLGDFQEEWYWSSTTTDDQAWEQLFPEGVQQNDGGGNESLSLVRPVRHIILNIKKVGDLHEGGIIFQIDSLGEHGKVVSQKDLGFFNWYDAKTQCEEYSDGEYTDWYLPSREDLQLIYDKLYPLDMETYPNSVAQFREEWYWSASETKGQAWEIDFLDGLWQNDGGGNNSKSSVRAVRDF